MFPSNLWRICIRISNAHTEDKLYSSQCLREGVNKKSLLVAEMSTKFWPLPHVQQKTVSADAMNLTAPPPKIAIYLSNISIYSNDKIERGIVSVMFIGIHCIFMYIFNLIKFHASKRNKKGIEPWWSDHQITFHFYVSSLWIYYNQELYFLFVNENSCHAFLSESESYFIRRCCSIFSLSPISFLFSHQSLICLSLDVCTIYPPLRCIYLSIYLSINLSIYQ